MVESKIPKTTYVGKVISDAMDKTVVVRIQKTYMDPVLHKVMRKSKKYKVHDQNEVAKIGDTVEFYQGRPISKTKCMYLYQVVHASQGVQ